MPLDSVVTGPNTRQILVVGDPGNANALLSVGQFHSNGDGQSLTAALYSLLVGEIGLLKNSSGTFDVQRSAVGTVGVAASNTEGTKTTYSAGVVGIAPATAATDFWQILASSTKTVRILRISISASATAAATVDIALIKRTSLNTGGTAASIAIAQHDSNDVAPTAAVNYYSTNPSTLATAGAAVVRAQKLNVGTAGAAGVITWDFSTRNGKGLVLRSGTTHQYVLNWNGEAVPSGASVNIDVEFTEE